MSSLVNNGTPQLFQFLYPNAGWRDLWSFNHPFLSTIPKKETSTGIGNTTGVVHVWNWAPPAGVSFSYAAAVGQQDQLTQGQQFYLQTSQVYGALRLDAKEMVASRSRPGAYMSSQKLNVDKIMKNMSQILDLACHNSNGIVGTIVDVTNNVITLNSATSSQQWVTNMRIVSASTNPQDGTAPAPGPGDTVVEKVSVELQNEQLLVQLTVANPAGFDSSTNKYIARKGNLLGFSAANTSGGLIGQGNWVPTTKVSANDNFLGVINRSTDEARMTGSRLVAPGMTYREAIQTLAAQINSLGYTVDMAQLNPLDWMRASLELQQFVRYETVKVGNVGFDVMVIQGPGGKIQMFSDPNQPVGEIRLNTRDSWVLYHMGELVQFVNEDGLQFRKDAGADAFQWVFRSWPQLGCYEPGANGVILL